MTQKRTYRLDDDITAELVKRAREYGISENQLVNKWLKRYLYLDPLQKYLHAITLGRDTLLNIAKSDGSKEDLERVGRFLGGIAASQLFPAYNIKPSLATVITALDQVYSKTCGWFEFKQHSKKDACYLILLHEMGSEWTAFLKGYFESYLKVLLNLEPKVRVTDNMLEFTIPEKALEPWKSSVSQTI